MTSLRAAVAACTLAFGLMGCGSNLCDRSTKAATAKGSDCGAVPLLGAGCSSNLSSCSEADQKVLDSVLTCLEKLPVCQSIAKDAWKLQEDACNAHLQTLSAKCSETFFAGMPPGFDAGLPDAGPQSINDGGNGLSLVGVANQDTIALAWEPRRSADSLPLDAGARPTRWATTAPRPSSRRARPSTSSSPTRA